MSKRRKKLKYIIHLIDTPTLRGKKKSVLKIFSNVRLFYIMSIVKTTLLITRPDII